MNLLFLQIVLTIWTGLALCHVILGLIALMFVFTNNSVHRVKKFAWTIAVIFVPFLGALSFFTFGIISRHRQVA